LPDNTTDKQLSTSIENTTELTAQVVSAYVTNNTLPLAELPNLIASVHASLTRLDGSQAEPAPEKLTPLMPIKKTITPDHLISLEDGKRYKSLKRHLSGRGLTPQQYREKWSLPADYPMVAPNYSAQRSEMARSLGLGRKREVPAPAPAKRGRARKAA
jgi:predicted transcriptional regulator